MNTKKKSVPAFVRKPEFVTIIILIIMINGIYALYSCRNYEISNTRKRSNCIIGMLSGNGWYRSVKWRICCIF